VSEWLRSLPLSPKSRTHIKGLISQLWDWAMFIQAVAIQRNPMELVTVKDATKRQRVAVTLTVDDLNRFVSALDEPFNLIALLSACTGLRINECLGLQWGDIREGCLYLQRGIVRQHVGELKTEGSCKPCPIEPALMDLLNMYRNKMEREGAGKQTDWVFASPIQLYSLPWSYPWVQRIFRRTAKRLGLDGVSTHSMRHSFRAYLQETQIGKQNLQLQKVCMRHSDIRTTVNTYAHVACVTPEQREASKQVAALVLGNPQAIRKPVQAVAVRKPVPPAVGKTAAKLTKSPVTQNDGDFLSTASND
jgi:integrase